MRAKVSEHLEELRSRLLNIAVFFIFFLIFGFIFSPMIIKKIISDLLIANVELVSLSPIEFIYTQIRVSFYFAIALSSPLIIYHAARFVKPGLKRNEIKGLAYILPGIFLFFILGLLFTYFIFLKTALFFLAGLSSLADIANMWSIERFISFVVGLSLAVGLIFEMPLVLVVLHRLNIVKIKHLKKFRPYIYVGCFIIAALLTPPDVVTQILIALPIIILYEFSLLLMRIF